MTTTFLQSFKVIRIPMAKPSILPLFIVAVVVGDFALNTYGIRFPYYWHPDEIGKVDQVRSGVYNFYHPQLMLQLARFAREVTGAADTVRDTMISGRLASAAATAIAIASFATIVARQFGIAFGALTAVLLAITPSVFLNAHYFKEDASLLMGVALTMLCIQNIAANSSTRNLVLLALALGITISAKYVGVFMVAPVIAILIHRVRALQIVYCLVLAASVFLLVNGAGIFGRSSLTAGLIYELKHVTTSHGGVEWGPTSSGALKMFMGSAPLLTICLWLTGVGMLVSKWLRPQQTSGTAFSFECILFLTPIVLLIVNQFSMVIAPRYFLVATVLATVGAIWTAASVFSSKTLPAARYAPIILIVIAGASTAWSFAAVAGVFRNDPRSELAVWIANNLPKNARIAQDFYSGLPTPDRAARDPAIVTLPQSITMAHFHMGAAGSVAALQAQGYTHMVISSGGFDRFYDPAATLDARANDQKEFFDKVFKTMKPVHEVPRKSNVDPILSSRILVYDLRNN